MRPGPNYTAPLVRAEVETTTVDESVSARQRNLGQEETKENGGSRALRGPKKVRAFSD